MADAAFAGIRVAHERIDLTTHAGVHPRIGAADVIPFIPLDGATMDDCVALAHSLGERVGRELRIPVYLYERAATHASRRNLADVRRGGFELLSTDIARNPNRIPDYGPREVHPTAGAVAIGARPFLIAFNAYLGDASHLPIAKRVARTVRESNGGLPAVKALGLEVDGQAQVSMNLVDVERTSLVTAFDAVVAAAQAEGVEVTWSEIIGLVPERTVWDIATQYLRLREPVADHVLERRILDLRMREPSLHSFLEGVGSETPVPGGGSVAAYTGALAAALVKMVARLTLNRERFATVHTQMAAIAEEADQLTTQLYSLASQDADAYSAVMTAYQLPHETDGEIEAREEAIHLALQKATDIPLQVCHLSMRVLDLAESVVAYGNPAAITDSGTAGTLARAAIRAAAYNVRVNANALGVIAGESAQEASELLQTAERRAIVIEERVMQILETNG
jgi:glutamate formiminotransferase/formiminotetrahydrofolate cyclodeaminase